MTATSTRAAAIGLGHWGKNIARNLDALGALAAMYDADPATRAQFSELYPAANCTESVEEILQDETISAVMIATPAVTHGALVNQALDAGKDVFVEKPICLDVDEAEQLREKAISLDRVLMVGHLLLYHPAFEALLACVQAGELGKLRYVYSNRASLGKIRREENALWSFAPHDISMILQLAGRLPDKVTASGSNVLAEGIADTTLSHLDFGEGLQAHIFVSWLHPYKDQRLVVVGDKAMAVFNDVEAGDNKLLLYRHKASWNGSLPVIAKADAEPIAYGSDEPLERECRVFLEAAAGRGAKPPSDAAEGVRVLRVLDACQRAINEGGSVAL
jgi:UDP-2-acetamido-3-amino-2,3-dideoxy-glucuronate N-acetyltransferase